MLPSFLRVPGDTARFLSELVPWTALAAPGVMLNKHRFALQRTYQVRGIDLAGTTVEAQGAMMLAANNALKRLDGQWMLHAEAQRHAFTEYPEMDWHYPVAALIDHARSVALTASPGSRETRYFLTLTWTPAVSTHGPWYSWAVAGAPPAEDKDTHAQQALETFLAQTDIFMAMLRGVLAVAAPASTEETYTYLHSTVSTRWHRVGVLACPTDIDTQLCDTPYTGGWAPYLGHPDGDGWHLRLCTIRGYPAQSTAGVMRALEAADINFRWCTRWIGMERAMQAGLLQRRQQAWVHGEKSIRARIGEAMSKQEARIVNTDATNKAEQADVARQELGADIVAYGQFSTTVVVWAGTPSEADAAARYVQQAFDTQGFTTAKETHHATAAWLSTHPGNRMDNVRRTPQSSLTLAHLCPGLTSVWSGPARDAHLNGPPWFYAHTNQSSVFRVINHINDLGHFLVLGPTRSGKSTLAGLMVAQWLKYQGAQVHWWDIDRTARLLTLLLGGHWYDIAGGDIALQPLRHIDDERERAWALEWLMEIYHAAGFSASGHIQSHFSGGLRALAAKPPPCRTISGLVETLAALSRQTDLRASAGRVDAHGIAHPDQRLQGLVMEYHQARLALQPFTQAGDYGWLLDADHDDLEDGPIHTFEQKTLLTMPRLVGPVTRYLFHRLEQRYSTDRPTLDIKDDAAITMTLDAFAQDGKTKLMTTAKKNVSMGFFTHSLSQVFESSLGPLLLESCPTRFFLPNPGAMAPQMAEVYAKLGLAPEAIRQIATSISQRDVYYHCEPLGARLLHLPLDTTTRHCIAHNTAADHTLMDTLLAKYGREGFYEAWLAHHHLAPESSEGRHGADSRDRRGQPVPEHDSIGARDFVGSQSSA